MEYVLSLASKLGTIFPQSDNIYAHAEQQTKQDSANVIKCQTPFYAPCLPIGLNLKSKKSTAAFKSPI